MNSRGLAWFLLLMFAQALAPSAHAQQDLTDQRLKIVDRSILFHGGSVFQQSQSELEICSKSGCYSILARVDRGVFDLDVSGQVRGQNRRVRISNETLEYWLDGEAMEIPAGRSQSLRNWVMARVYFVYLPYRLGNDSVIQEDLGIEIWNDKPLHKIKVSFVPGSSSGADDEFLYWFDPETARLEMFAYSFAGDPGGLRFRRAFNYRRIGGILFFDQENWGLDGDDLTVEMIDPESVSGWDLVSTVKLSGIEVKPLEP